MNVPQVECERHHAGLSVSNVTAAVEFYTTKLGFRLAFTDGEPPTFAGVNLGVQELKKKHGIDYDSHASYRFVE